MLGKRRDEISLIDIQQAYAERYDIEHFFRFSKRNLLMDSHQTADVEHEEQWWQLCSLAYMQLYLAKEVVSSMPQPWERYLPGFKDDEKDVVINSPAKTQRGMAQLLETIGTPASPCVPRGKPIGRIAGETQPKRETKPIVFKEKKPTKTVGKSNVSASDLTASESNPKKIEDIVDWVQSSLKKLDVTLFEFSKVLENSS